MSIRRSLGRPATAPAEVRANNYKNEKGKYVITSGLKFWHERVVDFLLLNPNARRVDIARKFDVTPEWVGMLVGSDAFKEYYEGRMREHQKYLSAEVVHRMQGLAVQSMEKLSEHLSRRDVPTGQVKDVAELALKSLGFGARQGGVSVNVSGGDGDTKVVVGVSAEGLARARERIAETRKKHTAELQNQGDGSDRENYTYVTSSLETPPEEIEDAVVVGGADADSES